jgi:hypothetical protein
MGVSVTPREEDGEVVPSDAVRQVTLNVSCVVRGLVTDSQPGRGATLSLPAGDVEIELNSTTAQDVLLDLGPPLRKYWKEDDRMDRMWVHSDAATAVSTPSACFWNYFQHGLDLLVVDGVVTKIIVHSNIVCRRMCFGCS